MPATRLPDRLRDLVGDSRFVAVTVSNEFDEAAVSFSAVGGNFADTNYYLHGAGIEPSADDIGIPAVWIKAGTRAVGGCTLKLSQAPGSGQSYRIGLTFKRNA